MIQVKVNTFEDQIGEIDLILSSKRSFWTLDAINHVDYDDVCQIIRIHIYKKFDQWNQSQPFSPWVSKLINRQIINLKQKFYGRLAPPCQKCEFNLGGGLCGLTPSGEKNAECPKFLKWEKTKETAYRLMLAESSDKTYYDEEDYGEGRVRMEAEIAPDYVEASERLHELVMKGLSAKKKDLYRWFFIEHRSDEFVAAQMNYVSTEEGESPGRRQILNVKKELINRAKDIMKTLDIFAS